MQSAAGAAWINSCSFGVHFRKNLSVQFRYLQIEGVIKKQESQTQARGKLQNWKYTYATALESSVWHTKGPAQATSNNETQRQMFAMQIHTQKQVFIEKIN